MRVSDEKEKYLEYYFENIHFMGGLEVGSIRIMAECKGQGAEYVSCSYDPDDEDYKEGYVTMFFWRPADDEDTMVFVENKDFFEYLLKVCQDHILKCPEDEERLMGYISTIKKDLNV